jgi:glycosidase
MSQKISIYQTFPRLFGNKTQHCIHNGTMAQNGCGKFKDFSDKALFEIRNLGITHIWYTGIIEHGTMTDYSDYSIQKDNPALLKGRAGSPYAIKDYYDIDPDLAIDPANRMAEFEALLNRTKNSGLKIIIDFIPNHLFRQYKSDQKPKGIRDFGEDDDSNLAFSPLNNFYYIPNTHFKIPENIDWLTTINNETDIPHYEEFPAKATGNDKFEAQPDKNDWYETVKLNYGIDILNNRSTHFEPIPDTWHKMLNILKYWSAKGVDGFRCDMAEMVPVEFWEWAIGEIKKLFPNLIFIAEIYNPFAYHDFVYRGGFDYLYDKEGLYDTLKNIIRHNVSTNAITGCWQALHGLDSRMLRFLENHDEVRLASNEFAGDPRAAIPCMTVAAAMNTGPVMIYNGQEVGEPAAGTAGFSSDDGRTTIFDYFIMPEHQKWMNNGMFDGGQLTKAQLELRAFYKNLLNLSVSNQAISEGQFYDLMYANTHDSLPCRDKIFAWLRYTENQTLLFVVNFDRTLKTNIRIKIPEHALDLSGNAEKKSLKFEGLMNFNTPIEISAKAIINNGLNAAVSGYDAVIIQIL